MSTVNTVSAILELTKLLVSLGFEVYKAVESGDTTKTVGEIMAGRKSDMDRLRELDEEAKRKFGVG